MGLYPHIPLLGIYNLYIQKLSPQVVIVVSAVSVVVSMASKVSEVNALILNICKSLPCSNMHYRARADKEQSHMLCLVGCWVSYVHCVTGWHNLW